ncbi:hypothetical protein JMF89_00935 [Clostridiaceae bacterium UIB06]|uniref:Uncharacterized protein n=1 Tax=Clostridium thailandense TaxID=2794346 RepID=A0A949TYB1_9CLOT|nr:hypothetical protein [Clostridium thailandense]MBV7273118.1 hypothetical protein [Clostridium thailandense]MCH5135782.1 hypothetical protein [Clostridiaceae bacterium UIB06]
MENQNLNKELASKIPKMIDNLKQGKEVTLKITPRGLKVHAAEIKVIK